MKRFLILAILLLPLILDAQTVQLSGTTEPTASVTLRTMDGSPFTRTTADINGGFKLNAVRGQYVIKITAVGYESYETRLALNRDTLLERISLKATTAQLGEVVIIARKELVEYKADRIVFDVERSINASNGNALQALGAAPGVMLENGNITLAGRGPARVYIDGRPVELTGDELAGYLRALPAADISNIEVIRTPPAKYDAGGSGIININLKQARANSWKNTLLTAYDQNLYSSFGMRDNFLYNKGPLRLAASGGGQLGFTQVKQNLDTYYPDGPWQLRYTGRERTNNASALLSADYKMSKRSNAGFQYQWNFNEPGSDDLTNISAGDSLLVNTGERQLLQQSQAFNGHLLTALDTSGRKLSLDADIFNYRSRTSNVFTATGSNGVQQSALNDAGQHIYNYSLKADMEHPLKFISLSYGLRRSRIISRATIRFFNTMTGIPILDARRSDDFDYRETSEAAYVSGSKKLGNKVNLQAGLRMEHTAMRGYTVTLDQVNTNNYLRLFPSLYLDYQHNLSNRLLVSYGRRINRPNFSLLNPFRSYINSNNYSEGNPFLLPSFNDNLEITHIYHGKWRTSLFLNLISDGFGPVFRSDPSTQTLVISRKNYLRQRNFGIGEDFTAQPAPWWESHYQLYLIGSDSHFSRQLDAAPQNGLQFYLSTSQTFQIGKNTSIQADYQYSTPNRQGLYRQGYISGLNVGLKQTLLHNRLHASLLVNDIFNTAYLKGYTSVVNGSRQVYQENNSSRFFRLSLTYNIGNDKLDNKQHDFSNEEERKRTD